MLICSGKYTYPLFEVVVKHSQRSNGEQVCLYSQSEISSYEEKSIYDGGLEVSQFTIIDQLMR